jgi:glycosyltransferase involved in cell wall biosynthesis
MAEVRPEDVSLYIPARNSARTLAAAVAGALTQRVAPAELFLVIDMRSSDETAEIARRTGVRIIEQHERGLGHARNLAIASCRTRWLASCDADVVIKPTWLEWLLARCGDDVAAVGGGTHERLITPADRWRAVNMPHNWGPLSFDNPFMLVSEMVADVRALRSVGGYRADLSYWEDSDLCQRLRHAGYTLRYEPAAVAYHDRRDSVESVLNLRWVYSAHRQRTRLETLPGLVSKLAINRGYCIQSLSQTLHSDHADVCAISVLLWFHHARSDLRAALEPLPLLDEAARGACVERLDDVLGGCLTGSWERFRDGLSRLLSTFGRGAPQEGALVDTPGFAEYLAAARDATTCFLGEIPESVTAAVVQSVEGLAAGQGTWAFARPALRVSVADEQALADLPRTPAWRWGELAETLATACGLDPDDEAVQVMGPSLAGERPAGGRGGYAPGGLVLIPHVEAYSDPLGALRAALERANAAVLAYQPPVGFIPAVPILAARDLAACCAQAGWAIRHFHTEAGLTRLIVTRTPTAERQPDSSRRRVLQPV